MIRCNKCAGKVFVDLTFTDNKNYETYCIRCGKRDFVGPWHSLFPVVKQFVKEALVG